eukprot:3946648-Pyramimonas_sp.AAC.1
MAPEMVKRATRGPEAISKVAQDRPKTPTTARRDPQTASGAFQTAKMWLPWLPKMASYATTWPKRGPKQQKRPHKTDPKRLKE